MRELGRPLKAFRRQSRLSSQDLQLKRRAEFVLLYKGSYGGLGLGRCHWSICLHLEPKSACIDQQMHCVPFAKEEGVSKYEQFSDFTRPLDFHVHLCF